MWNPARLSGYVFTQEDVKGDNEVVEDNQSDHVSDYVWKEEKRADTDRTEKLFSK